MSTMVLQSFLLVILLIAGLSYACQDAKQLPELQRRSRNTKVNGDDPLVNDLLLTAGWYTVTNPSGQYKMPDSNFIPPLDGCGTINQIFIKDTHPDVLAAIPVNVVACVQTIFYDCYNEINISIRNCTGELQYYLPITGRDQAYCFDPPAIQGTTNFLEAPENFSPGVVTISSNLKWRVREDIQYNMPELYFECSFIQTEGLLYTVTWYVDGKIQFIKGPIETTNALQLTTSELVEKGFHLGINLQCGVQASADSTGSLTRSTFSSEFFAGIKIISPSIILDSTADVSVEFCSTVPIGCAHSVTSATCGQRTLSVQMKTPDHNCESAVTFQRCNKAIELLSRNVPLTSGVIYNFKLTSNFKFLEPTHLELHLETDNSFEDRFFAGQSLQTVSVIVDKKADWTPSHCYSYVDPHMKTFDNVYYENQESGDFVLYRNTKYGIEVQERTMPCYTAKCTCQVAVRAGADVFVINRCPGTTWFNEFLACKDGGILDAVEINAKEFKIYTPIGMVVRITTGIYGGYFMNVDIFSSPKDLYNVEGLCGYYDGNSINDFKMPDGSPATYRNTDYMFSRSWMVTKDRGLLTGYVLDNLENWASLNSLLCVCKQSGEFIGNTQSQQVDEASCEKLDNTACAYKASITQKKCNKIGNRRRRSIFQHTFNREHFLKTAYKQVAKRSIDSNILTEEEVRGNCSNMIRNAPSVIQFPERLMGEDIDEVVEHCVFDVMAADGDLSVGEIHVLSLDNVVKQTFSYEPNFVANNTDIIQSFLRETCPNNCSGRGVCSEAGECICASLYHGRECELYEADPINVDSIEGDGVCDTALGDDCRCHWFYTNNLLDNFSCKFRQFKVDLDNNKTYLDELVVPGDYDDLFTGQCCLPETRPKRSVQSTGLGYEWELAVSNDGTHFGSGQTLFTIDQSCLDVVNSSNNERTLKLKDGYCLINFQCVANTEMMVSDHCQTCSVQEDQFGWTNVCKIPDEPSIPIVGIAVGSAVGLFVVVCVVLWICWKHNNKKALVDAKNTDERCLDNSRSKFQMNKFANVKAQACDVYAEHHYETVERGRCTPDLFRVNDLTSESTPKRDRQTRPGSASGISFVLNDIPFD